MSAMPKPKLTADEYVVIENRAEFKSEYFNGEMFAMAGAAPRHNFIKDNLIGELFGRLKGGPCRTASSDQRLLVSATGLFTYPDLVVVCGTPEYAPADPYALTNPVAILEVLSASTERYDRGAKFRNYQRIPTLTEYVLVSQDEPVCERFVRQADGSWGLVSFVGLDATFAFTSVSAAIPLADIYRGVTFPDDATGDRRTG